MLKTELFPYQHEAVERALSRRSLLIAYEMGLGKTLCALAVTEELLAYSKIDVAVIVVPAGLKWQWAQALAQHTDLDTQTIIAKGLDGPRREIRVPLEEWCMVIGGNKESKKRRITQYQYALQRRPDYIIMGYENVVNDWDWVRKINPGIIILDEATAIKSFKAARTKQIKRFTAEYRIALSGQPVEAHPEELFSLMQWVDHTVLGRYDLFDKSFIKRNYFGGVKAYQNLDILHERLSEAMVRKTRLDPDVAPYLPDVQEEDIYIKMDPAGKRLYNRIAQDFAEEILKPGVMQTWDEFAHYHGGDEQGPAGKATACYAALLALCDHPDLLVESAERYEAGKGQGSRYCWELWQEGFLDDVIDSPKMADVCAEVRIILETHPNSKVIVFTRYRLIIDLLRRQLKEYQSVLYHGQMGPAEKANAQHAFRNVEDVRLFLSTSAGTYGVDLPEATHLINYDPPENAGRRGQRNARHVRAGSKHSKVYVINALIQGSIEVRKLLMTMMRSQLATTIMDGSGSATLLNDIPSVTKWLKENSV